LLDAIAGEIQPDRSELASGRERRKKCFQNRALPLIQGFLKIRVIAAQVAIGACR
jgi:hypothetical protein